MTTGSPKLFMATSGTSRRVVRSATYHRHALASPAMARAGSGQPSVVRTRSSLLRRALRSLGCSF
ncbi:MAG: hypothetical protein ABW067_08925 [Rhizobacter sp.]